MHLFFCSGVEKYSLIISELSTMLAIVTHGGFINISNVWVNYCEISKIRPNWDICIKYLYFIAISDLASFCGLDQMNLKWFITSTTCTTWPQETLDDYPTDWEVGATESACAIMPSIVPSYHHVSEVPVSQRVCLKVAESPQSHPRCTSSTKRPSGEISVPVCQVAQNFVRQWQIVCLLPMWQHKCCGLNPRLCS